MHIIINNSSMVPIYEQVVNQIKNGIISGQYENGQALPSVRGMAAELRISSLTVKKAYDLLEEEGFVTTVHGKGTFVNAADTQIALEARRRAVEDDFALAIDRAISAGLNRKEIEDIVEILLEERNDKDR